jgi:hypothetical protein
MCPPLEKAFSIMTTDYGVWKLQILDDGLKLSFVLLGDLATEDHGDLLGLADSRITAFQEGIGTEG